MPCQRRADLQRLVAPRVIFRTFVGERVLRREGEDLGRGHGQVPPHDGVTLGARHGCRLQRGRHRSGIGERGWPHVSSIDTSSPKTDTTKYTKFLGSIVRIEGNMGNTHMNFPPQNQTLQNAM